MPTKKRERPIDRKIRLHVLELAATGHYDTPKMTMARARSYLNFVMYGPAPKTKGRKRPISRPSRKPLMTRRKKR